VNDGRKNPDTPPGKPGKGVFITVQISLHSAGILTTFYSGRAGQGAFVYGAIEAH
jgi:hypothetical protein